MATFIVEGETQHRDAIKSYLSQCFRLNPVTQKCGCLGVVDAVIQEIVGRSQCRFGSVPPSQSLTTITGVITNCIDKGIPIPMLCPWGSRKLHETGADVADLGALRTIECLNQRVKTHHKPGIAVNMRIENIGGHLLFADRGDAGRKASSLYVNDILKLIEVLNLDCVKPVPESTLMTEVEHSTLARTFIDLLVKYITETDEIGIDHREDLESWSQLKELGWQGEIPVVQRDYYRFLYRNHYPGLMDAAYTLKLATYLASSLARYKLKATGEEESWGSQFLSLNFCPPVPGAPQGLSARAVYYRTVPESVTKIHIPPWRAKGYLKIVSGSPCLKIASRNESLLLDQCTVRIERDSLSVSIDSPILEM